MGLNQNQTSVAFALDWLTSIHPDGRDNLPIKVVNARGEQVDCILHDNGDAIIVLADDGSLGGAVEDVEVPSGYMANRAAYLSGYRHERNSFATQYPGPDRSAHQAGWVQRQRDDNANDTTRPPEGWSEPDSRGHITFTQYDAGHAQPPEREGYECYFVGVHGTSWTRWTYKPVNPPLGFAVSAATGY